MTNHQNNMDKVVSLFRYPVKSMIGEELNATDVTPYGLLGDCAYALVDGSDGKNCKCQKPAEMAKSF